MSITIRPDGSIITDTAAEAVSFLKEQQIAERAPYQWGGVSDPDGFLMRPDVAENIRTALSSSGLATESAATTATGVVEGGPVEDTPEPPRSRRRWTPEEEGILKRRIRNGWTCRKVGDLLGRSESSVNNKLLVLEAERRNLRQSPIRPEGKK